ncbi:MULTISPECIES: tRNA adenosine deaminase-associated protein [unclassified Modestobacter]|uniref:tRNA adenosine deaminase-associated protein n=1 Tax=unclassified Modestobacter TaxID=2643866 RepID=UPI0022AAE0F4|nr:MULTISPECIES: tRNA adenosine deaminase-associated protein [unclassified Modestobacter]MCZ2825515.1 tRNA adenosine deaminase-associated protein [Modestobacter sp. VKM Ac-2981]MCZ2853420.1 tRNA adenosine deaminase-associated protein [Modestobacter sp. VKM Ac-2982]
MALPSDSGTSLQESFAVRVSSAAGRWQCELLAADADDELPALERALGDPGAAGWPGPFVLVVDSRLYFVVLRHGPGGMVRALISDATFQEHLLAAEVVERYGIPVETGTTVDDAFDADEQGRPGGDLDVLADAGLPAEELSRLLDSDELWADEVVLAIAERLGFADELRAVAAP